MALEAPSSSVGTGIAAKLELGGLFNIPKRSLFGDQVRLADGWSRKPKNISIAAKDLEAGTGIEPVYTDLQSAA